MILKLLFRRKNLLNIFLRGSDILNKDRVVVKNGIKINIKYTNETDLEKVKIEFIKLLIH